jgi:RNA polymerase sigma factor (sigma-70 family)
MIPSVADPMQPTHEKSAVDAARAGEPKGFDDLYRRLAPQVTGFARARGAADPEGICNEVFLRCFRKLSSFTGDDAAFRRWAFSITRNLLIDAHRRDQRRPDEIFRPPPEAASPAAETEALANLAEEDLSTLLAPLTEEQREVIVLRLIADLSLADTAEIVGRPVAAVKRLQARGLRRLQAEILGREVSS